MIFGNLIGFGTLFVSLLAGWVVSGVFRGGAPSDNDLSILLPAGAVAALIDVAYRWTKNRNDGPARMVRPTKGGSIMWLPVWALGIVTMMVAFIQ
jgi:hypothetical protein